MDNHQLKRTDTKSVPSLISNKYDTPQKNARKIKWDSDEEEDGQQSLKKRWKTDAEMMPPPPIPKSPPSSSKRPKLEKRDDSPHPKKKMIKHIKPSEMIGQCPSKILMLLYDIEKKQPFRLSMNIDDYSYHVFKMIEYAKENKIELKVDNIILYCYQFIEKDYEHKIEVINDDIGKKAIEVCEENKLCPFDNDSDTIVDNNIKEKYKDLLYMPRFGILKFNEGQKLISCNKLLYYIINIIVTKSIELDKKINYEICGDLLEFKEANDFEIKFLRMMEIM
tara:strand:+ start:5756 stop:6592 length:837 start_codon:yes stop_codon:yes gene_type:complete